ncbi:YitT family protein [Metabacillus litoralis]|uniref:YitT family protein n=1 Tax=Metabacillus litoralis TaxID=152268 RepID=A0A5C6W511_9BACI|nr:YitT family protein [Metabacillus litoralis]TXC93036.1 YitT family protein [Metabacillus litoralis]
MNIIIKKALILGLAAVIQGLAMTVFLFPHFIPSGGAASISVLLNYLFEIQFALTLFILNASFLLAAVKWLGKESALWTMFCVTVTSATINTLTPYILAPISNVFLDLVLGSVIFGVGLGILFKMGASSGGMDILALILAKITGLLPGRILFVVNGTLLLSTGFIVDVNIIIYAVICQFIGTRILDFVYKLPVLPSLSFERKGFNR